MNARPQEVQSEVASLPENQLEEVQRLALTGYDFDHATHLVLKVKEPNKARAFLAQLLQDGVLTFSDTDRTSHAVNIGFTYRGLEALGLSTHYLRELEDKAPAFRQGAPTRAARRLGDAGASAAERWEPIFAADCAHALVSIHGVDSNEVHALARKLASGAEDKLAFECLDSDALRASHLTNREVHFGFRDSIARPVIAGATSKGGKPLHSAGELLLGYPNDEKFNPWGDAATPEVARFFRNGSFAAVRKIEQDEKRFDDFLRKQADGLKEHFPEIDANYLRAKLCGRWSNGAVVKPGVISEPAISPNESPASLDDFNFKDDPDGFGCPFGAHIRRTNPRDDPIAPPRSRPLFRRGMPYGPKYSANTQDEKRGLVGLFFCASLEDQFEHVMLEWIEKKPMGPRHRGSAKDPLAGHHDEPAADFYIPQGPAEADIKLTGFTPFLTTRGTLYALFPSRSALKEIASISPQATKAAQGSDVKQKVNASSSPSDKTQPLETETKTEPAPIDRFCDVVMEGGVTSGIIYASAVAELAPHYRFRNIGGSSIGAFAAALTAAAEYSRRYTGSDKPFQGLAELPDKLAEEDANGHTRLRQLFKPQKETRRLFEIFLATLGHEKKKTRVFYGLIATLWQYRLHVFMAAIATAALAVGPFVLLWLGWFAQPPPGLDLQLVGVGSWALASLFALAFAVVAAVVLGMVLDFRRLARNGFGVCRGWSADEPTDSQDLTGYLHQSIQLVAGRDAIKDPPLTFKDLWDAPKRATDVLNYTGNEYARRSINLEIYATNLAHGRPYRFPLEEADDMGRLFFCIEEMATYFPEPIVRHLVAYGRPYRARGRSDPDKITEPGKTKGSEKIGAPEKYLELPREHLPLAVAARLALSFPFLISAVPLWAIDYEPKKRAQRQLARCWMSDGGLCSNFPIHLFDSFLPKWPTFGISLQTRSKYWEDDDTVTVWLPDKHYEGAGDSWNRFAESGGPLEQLKGFLLSLWMATWHWNDMTMMRMPGVRDRVVRVLLREGEGGVNIKMSGQQIRDLAKNYGKPAADAFVQKFARENSPGWPEHRWVRFNRLLISLREQIDCFGFTAGLKRHTLPLEKQIEESVEEQDKKKGPLRGHPNEERLEPSEKPLKPEQVAELKHLLSALATFETTFQKAGDHTPYIAMPRPSLRVRHPT